MWLRGTATAVAIVSSLLVGWLLFQLGFCLWDCLEAFFGVVQLRLSQRGYQRFDEDDERDLSGYHSSDSDFSDYDPLAEPEWLDAEREVAENAVQWRAARWGGATGAMCICCCRGAYKFIGWFHPKRIVRRTLACALRWLTCWSRLNRNCRAFWANPSYLTAFTLNLEEEESHLSQQTRKCVPLPRNSYTPSDEDM